MKKLQNVVKALFNLTLVLVLLFPYFMPSYLVKAADNRTIRTILEDIERQKKEIENNKEQQKLTDQQINTIKNNIALIDSQIKEGNNQIIQLNNEIEKLEIEIIAKDEEIKKIVNFLQTSSGESEYMEYIFGAKDFTDFIYRVAVTEQVTDYNDKLVKEYNEMIETNKKRQEEIRQKEKELSKKQETMQAEIAKLSSQLTELNRELGDFEGDLDESQKAVQALIDDGCGMDETVDACYARLRTLPSDTKFWRPLTWGSITSLFGWRTYWYRGQEITDKHYGLDIYVPVGTPVYAVANGRISRETSWSGTGLVVYVEHIINGERYTSVYEHLSHNTVLPVGTNVTKDTVIAYSGNTGESTGPHLHLAIIRGWHITDWQWYWDQDYLDRHVDPKTKINFPAGYGSFYTRNKNCSIGSC